MAIFKSKKKKDEPAVAESQMPSNSFEDGTDEKPGWLKIDFDKIQKQTNKTGDQPAEAPAPRELTVEQILSEIKAARSAQPKSEPELARPQATEVSGPENIQVAEAKFAEPEAVRIEEPAPAVIEPEAQPIVPEPEQPQEPAPLVTGPEQAQDQVAEQADNSEPQSEAFAEATAEFDLDAAGLAEQAAEADVPDAEETNEARPDGKIFKRKAKKEKAQKAKKDSKEKPEKMSKEKSEKQPREKKKREKLVLFTPDMTTKRRRFMQSHLIFATLVAVLAFAASLALGFFFWQSNVFVNYINILLIALSVFLALCCVFCYIKYLKSLNHEYDTNFGD